MSLMQYLVNHAVKRLPPTHFFPLKSRLFRLAGVDAHPACRICSSATIWGNSPVSIGQDTWIGHDVLIVGGGSNDAAIRIGANVDIAPRVLLHSGSHEIDMSGAHSAGTGIAASITIEDGAWIGANATILGGVTIGRKSVIGAGSVVNKSIPPCVIAVGVPCRPIKKWDEATKSWTNWTQQAQ